MLRMCGQSCQTPALKSYELIFKKKKKQQPNQPTKKGDGFALFWKVHEHQALSVHLGLSFVSYECWLNACWFKAPFWGGTEGCPAPALARGLHVPQPLVAVAWRGSLGNPQSGRECRLGEEWSQRMAPPLHQEKLLPWREK